MSRPIGSPEELERRRRRAIELVKQGERPTVVARFLGVDRSSLYRWRQSAAVGAEGLAARPHPHRPPRLTDTQLKRLEELLETPIAMISVGPQRGKTIQVMDVLNMPEYDARYPRNAMR